MTAPGRIAMTVDDFLAWSAGWAEGERWELVEGVPVAMSPETNMHLLVKSDVYLALREAAKAAALDCVVWPDGVTVRIDAATAFEPDAALKLGRDVDLRSMTADAPMIVAEVLSPSTGGVDTGRKLEGYFRVPSIVHYLIVAPETRRVIHHARQPDGRIETRILGPEPFRLDPPGLALDAAAFFERI